MEYHDPSQYLLWSISRTRVHLHALPVDRVGEHHGTSSGLLRQFYPGLVNRFNYQTSEGEIETCERKSKLDLRNRERDQGD